ANHFDSGVTQERVKQTDSVGPATNAREKMRGQALFRDKNLFASFASDDGLKIAHHGGIRMRTENGAKKVMRGAYVGDPVAHGFVDGVLERAAAGIHRE